MKKVILLLLITFCLINIAYVKGAVDKCDPEICLEQPKSFKFHRSPDISDIPNPSIIPNFFHEAAHVGMKCLLQETFYNHIHMGKLSHSVTNIKPPLFSGPGLTVHSLGSPVASYVSGVYVDQNLDPSIKKRADILIDAAGPVTGFVASGGLSRFCFKRTFNRKLSAPIYGVLGLWYLANAGNQLSNLAPLGESDRDGYKIGENLGISKEKLHDPGYLPNKMGGILETPLGKMNSLRIATLRQLHTKISR